MSPVFRHGGLRLYLLGLLEESPRHGYDVIVELENRFMGTYAPSAGTVYPRLAKLEAEGLVRHDEVDGRKVYALTDAGRAELDAHRDELATVEQDVRDSVARVASDLRRDVGASARELRQELTSAARNARREQRASARTDREDRRDRQSFERDLSGFVKQIVRAVHHADPERVERARALLRRFEAELSAVIEGK